MTNRSTVPMALARMMAPGSLNSLLLRLKSTNLLLLCNCKASIHKLILEIQMNRNFSKEEVIQEEWSQKVDCMGFTLYIVDLFYMIHLVKEFNNKMIFPNLLSERTGQGIAQFRIGYSMC